MSIKINNKYKYFVTALMAIIITILAGTSGYAKDEVGPGTDLKEGNTASLNGVSIYVSKRTKTLSLKQNGVLIGEYPVSIGASSSDGNKKVEGDMRTPSGQFYVCTRNDKSVAYLALGLSYPGVEDAKRGFEEGIITQEQRDQIINANLAGQQPPWETALGGAIEIHGCRVPDGTTHGCVAVDNAVMDVLWSYCNLGVPVIIGP
ncbi:L,D-transpeptidase [Clostridium boliviensis]|uniref:L,D-transpeptidase n=1 Tax=Clostridium boliviensis TaxID=318465 RepID=A0ABU4GNL8_9CLOT|nr:L,D-transpeptidase [Clostridium boliviensis]MDW2799210.1 L,D-transpeptidase [Clostridium boliviensis]